MNDLYAECYVKPVPNAAAHFKKILLAAAAVLAVLAALLFFSMISVVIAAVIVGIICWRFPYLKVDYEYIFVDGQLDFDKIMGGEKRKNALRIDFEDLIVMAPEKSHALDSYKDCEVRDFSANNPEVKNYAIIISKGEKRSKIIFSPNEKMIAVMKNKTRSKIVEI